MSDVASTSPVAPTAAPQAPPSASPGSEAPSLLPEPLPSSDPMGMLFYFESNDQRQSNDDAARRIQDLQAARQQAMQQEHQAELEQMAAEKSHSFWDDLGSVFGEVAKVASVVVSVAAAVASCGAATPLAVLAIGGAVLSAAAFTDGEFHVLKSLGVKDDVANAIDTGLSIGGSVLSAGVGAAGNVGSVVQEAGLAVEAMGQVGTGVATIGGGQAQARADGAEADRIVDQASSDQAQRWTQATVDDLRTSDQASDRILRTIAGADAMQNDTAQMAAAAVRG